MSDEPLTFESIFGRESKPKTKPKEQNVLNKIKNENIKENKIPKETDDNIKVSNKDKSNMSSSLTASILNNINNINSKNILNTNINSINSLNINIIKETEDKNLINENLEINKNIENINPYNNLSSNNNIAYNIPDPGMSF